MIKQIDNQKLYFPLVKNDFKRAANLWKHFKAASLRLLDGNSKHCSHWFL